MISGTAIRRLCFGLFLASMAGLAGCVSQDVKRDAINDINRAFKEDYEAILARNGTRFANTSTGDAFDAVAASLVSLRMNLRQQSRGLGYLNADAPAPLPLDRAEWTRAGAADLPRAREILWRHVGPLAELFNFEPDGLDVVITATIIEARGGSEVSLTMRMREVAPPKSGMPRREYPPPSALQIGLDKIWAAFDRELKAKARTSGDGSYPRASVPVASFR
jgi:hypothetical protein